MSEAMPCPGDMLVVGGEASVQFQGERALTFRVIRVDPRMTYDGWMWIDGYVLGPSGDAVDRRMIFVRRGGLIQVERPAVTAASTSGIRRSSRSPATPEPIR